MDLLTYIALDPKAQMRNATDANLNAKATILSSKTAKSAKKRKRILCVKKMKESRA